MVEVCSAWNRATGGGANSSHQPPTLPDMPSRSTRENGSCRAQKRGLSVGVLWNFLRTGGRRLAAIAARWLVDGSVSARGRIDLSSWCLAILSEGPWHREEDTHGAMY